MPYDASRHGPRRVVGPGFHLRVFRVVAAVPPGCVTTYGDVADALGLRRAARHVGFALAALTDDRAGIPWHRVVDGRGRIRAPGERQRRRLRAEGVRVDREGRVRDLDQLRVPVALLRAAVPPPRATP